MTYQNHLVSDPNDSLRTGDVVRIARERRISRHIQHIVTEIVAPWGPGIDERPPVMSEDERLAVRREKKEMKTERKMMREAGTSGDEAPVDGMVEGTMVAS